MSLLSAKENENINEMSIRFFFIYIIKKRQKNVDTLDSIDYVTRV